MIRRGHHSRPARTPRVARGLLHLLAVFALLAGFGGPRFSMAKQDHNITHDPDGQNCYGTYVLVFEDDTSVESTYNGCKTDSSSCSENDDGESCSANCSTEICFEEVDDEALYFTDFVRGDCTNGEAGEVKDEKIHLGYSLDPDSDVKCEGFVDDESDCNLNWSCSSGGGEFLVPTEFVNLHVAFDGLTAHLTLINDTLPERTLELSLFRYGTVSDPYPLAQLNESLDPTLTPLAGGGTLNFGEQEVVDIPLPSVSHHLVFAYDSANLSAGSSSSRWAQFHREVAVPAVSNGGLVVLALLLAAVMIRKPLAALARR